jgi:hypothetical protein
LYFDSTDVATLFVKVGSFLGKTWIFLVRNNQINLL